MKKILGVLLFVAVMALPALALAGEQIGVYVAPKFVYAFNQMRSVEGYFHATIGIGDYNEGFGSKSDNTYGGALALGYDFGKNLSLPLRVELEYAVFSKTEAKWHNADDMDDEKIRQTFGVQTLFLNAYWDIKTATPLTPYLAAGLGLGLIKTKAEFTGFDVNVPTDRADFSTGSKNVSNFAWNVGAGLGYNCTESWTLDLGYRFAALGSVKTKTCNDGTKEFYAKTKNLYQHQLAVGVRYTF